MILYDSLDTVDYTKFIRRFTKKFRLKSYKGLPRFYSCRDCLLEMDEEPTVITRREWEARVPRVKIRQKSKVKKLVVTWTNSDYCHSKDECTKVLKKVQNEHMDDALCNDIRYNFMIGGDGNIYEGRGWRIRPEVDMANESEAEKLDENCIYMAFVGPEDGMPTPEMVKAISRISTVGVSRQYVDQKVTLVKQDGDEADCHEQDVDLADAELKEEEEIALIDG